jgi:hypothetical protein
VTDIARSLDETLATIQPWCTCRDPYRCEGAELLAKDDPEESE